LCRSALTVVAIVVALLAAVGGAVGAVVLAEEDDSLSAERTERPGNRAGRGRPAGAPGTPASDERSFAGAVDSILTDSRPAFREINEVAVEIRKGTGDLAGTGARVDGVIANRSARLGETTALEAPTAEAREVREKLALAFRRALDNNRDLRQAIDSYESGDSDSYLREAQEESVGTSDLARSAKRDFADAYNDLRESLGLPADVTAEF